MSGEIKNRQKDIPDPDFDGWLEAKAALPEARASMNAELDAVDRRLCAAADYGHYVVARERTKAVLKALWELECKLRSLVPLDDRYSRA